jgi:hypothetical protein
MGASCSGRDQPVLVILLGASNAARGQRALMHHLRNALAPRTVRFVSALGPGRGYCARGGFLHVSYAPIAASGVLEAAREQARGGARVVALVTDIGNDIMYGVAAGELVAGLEKLLAGLRALGARTVVTTIPVDLERDVGVARFRLLRALFFPRSPVTHADARAAVQAVNAFLVEHKADPGLRVVDDMHQFTGWDRIHYSLWRGHRAWTRLANELLAGLGLAAHGRIGRGPALGSVLAAAGRLVLRDMLRLRVRPKDEL